MRTASIGVQGDRRAPVQVGFSTADQRRADAESTGSPVIEAVGLTNGGVALGALIRNTAGGIAAFVGLLFVLLARRDA
jgi:hypothetical protein